MSRKKLRIHRTNTENLISNLRGEVGEIIYTWVLWRQLMAQANGLRTNDIQTDLANPQLLAYDALSDKLSDELVARLSELSEPKIGRLTFYFASTKLNVVRQEVKDFRCFIKRHRFHEKRNYDISHKELPEEWSEHKFIHIPYSVILMGIAAASRLMKAIDTAHLGPRAKYLWHEMRKRRYAGPLPAKAGYMALPFLWPSPRNRLKILREEEREGRDVWVEMEVSVDGRPTTIQACGEWGAIIVGSELMLLPESFVELTSIELGVAEGSSSSGGTSC